MPDVCRAYDAYEAYEVWKRFFREDGGRERLSTHGVRTPSTACELLPPSADGPPPSKREVLGLRRSRPSAFPSIAYRGFAVAPITLRASSRSLLYNPGCRVATLLVSMGVMGFLGDLRGRNSKSPPNPLGLAERVLRPQTVEGVRVQCLSILYTFVPICDSNKYIKTFVKPCFSKKISYA